MQAAFVSAIEKAIVNLWPKLEPMILTALTNVARKVIQQAKDGTFPDKYKALEPFFDAAADELLKLFPTPA